MLLAWNILIPYQHKFPSYSEIGPSNHEMSLLFISSTNYPGYVNILKSKHCFNCRKISSCPSSPLCGKPGQQA